MGLRRSDFIGRLKRREEGLGMAFVPAQFFLGELPSLSCMLLFAMGDAP